MLASKYVIMAESSAPRDAGELASKMTWEQIDLLLKHLCGDFSTAMSAYVTLNDKRRHKWFPNLPEHLNVARLPPELKQILLDEESFDSMTKKEVGNALGYLGPAASIDKMPYGVRWEVQGTLHHLHVSGELWFERLTTLDSLPARMRELKQLMPTPKSGSQLTVVAVVKTFD